MTTEKLIKILGAVDPESEVGLQLGHIDEDDYRDACAKVQITDGDCLDFLEIDEVFINEDGEGRLSPNLILRQFNYIDLESAAADFDKEYTKVRKQPDPDPKADIKAKRLADCELSVRTINICAANDIDTLGDLCKLHKTDWLKFRNGGKKSLFELDDLLHDHGLDWAEL